MKTIIDLREMKNQACPPFESAYDCLICTLEDYYISKLDGKSRIKQELENWEKEAQSAIIIVLIERLRPSLQDLNPNDLLDLL